MLGIFYTHFLLRKHQGAIVIAKKQLILIELEQKEQNMDLDENKEFVKNYQTSLLLSLLEKRQLTQWQFDRCMEELSKQAIQN